MLKQGPFFINLNLRISILTLTVLIACGCMPKADTSAPEVLIDRPKVSFTFDDGITTDILHYPFEDWNEMILASLRKEELTAAFFVTGRNKQDAKGRFLLDTWSKEGHLIANHTFTHPSFHSEERTVEDFEEELLKTDKVISSYDTYTKLFRFPYLKEGKTKEQIEGYRAVLEQHDYRNGHVTIDASDWYVNSQLISYMRQEEADTTEIDKYSSFYLQHILERANFYDSLAYALTDRHIPHTLLLHHNLSSALFLGDLIAKFKEEGWEVVDADEAFQDPFFSKVPGTHPAGESLVWSLAKETGEYEAILRYPAEDSQYEIPKMEKFGLQIRD
mgnify:CR=1 FL=1